MTAGFQLDDRVLADLRHRELEEFRKKIPKSRALYEASRRMMPNGVPCSWMSAFYPGTEIFAAEGEGCHFEDVDGNRYLDMTQCDLSMVCGYGPKSVAEAIAERFAKGSHFLMPTEDAIEVCQLLAERFGMPFWQFTLSASGANTEAIRISRVATGKDKVVVFAGKYHGHFDESLVERSEDGHVAGHLGLPKSAAQMAVEVPFNDLGALERALRSGDIACVLTEPAMTNCGVIHPEEGFHAVLRAMTRDYGVTLIIDETHTQAAAYGGFTRVWRLEPDILTLGKCVGGGMPLGCYGLTPELNELVEANTEPAVGGAKGLALGGTTYGSALNLAAARAALGQVLTKSGYERVISLGASLADGIDAIVARHSLPWRAHRLGNRSGICLATELPRNAKEASGSISRSWNLATRAFLANRGIWEPIYFHGPSVSFAHEKSDVDAYLLALGTWIDRVLQAH